MIIRRTIRSANRDELPHANPSNSVILLKLKLRKRVIEFGFFRNSRFLGYTFCVLDCSFFFSDIAPCPL